MFYKWIKKQRIYPSAPFENNDLEKWLEKKLGDVINFYNQINNNKEMIIYFKDKNHKSKKFIKITKLQPKYQNQ